MEVVHCISNADFRVFPCFETKTMMELTTTTQPRSATVRTNLRHATKEKLDFCVIYQFCESCLLDTRAVWGTLRPDGDVANPVPGNEMGDQWIFMHGQAWHFPLYWRSSTDRPCDGVSHRGASAIPCATEPILWFADLHAAIQYLHSSVFNLCSQ